MKTIGVLGGMGAETSAHFYHLINKFFQQKYNAEQDTDFAEMIIYNCPLSGFTEKGIEDFPSVKKQLVAAVGKLESMGADFIVIPCNSVHFFIDDMRNAVEIPILSIIEETLKTINTENSVGIICSQTTNEMKLYKSNSIAIKYPDKQQQLLLNSVIKNVIAGKQSSYDVYLISSVIASYGVNKVILGCTELPLAIKQTDTSLKLMNTLEILAEATVDFSVCFNHSKI